MIPNSKLDTLEKALELRYETLSKAEKRLAMTDDIFAKSAIEQRIREELLPEIRKYEAEYWKLLAQEADAVVVEEADAEDAITEVVQGVGQIEANPPEGVSDELVQLFQEIRDKLSEPGKAASAKMKLALPLIPGILAYEAELDTETTLRRLLQPIRKLLKPKPDPPKK